MGNFVKVAKVDQIEADRGLLVEVQGQKIALFHVGSNYYAIADTCTHVGGPLSEGVIKGEEVFCPWHGARFSLKTGEVLGPPARAGVASYPVRVVDKDVEVELP